MISPLSVDKETLKEFKIDPKHDVSPLLKLSFLQSQLEEMQHVFWRARMDVVHARRLQESDVEALRLKGNNNLAEHKNQVKQFYGGIVMIKTMIDELRKEYPELAVED